MQKSFNIDKAVEYVKIISDTNRCGICDKLDGTHMRYPCGHAVCSDCVIAAEECLICLTPQGSKPVPDNILTQRVNHVSVLLKTFEAVFNTNVYRRHRISEQLKVEKELFPECIQAPVKYCNKRKSLNISHKSKENIKPSFPGEKISPYKGIKMDNSISSVHEWLNKNEKSLSRKPFTDLSINQQRGIIRKSNLMVNKVNKINNHKNERITTKRHDKSSYFNNKIQSQLKTFLNTEIDFTKKTKSMQKEPFDQHAEKESKNENGFVIDDEPILIDDSESQNIDKDHNAWLAVLEANKYEQDDSTSIVKLKCNEVVNYNDDKKKTSDTLHEKITTKVMFYKRSYLLETCPLCNQFNDYKTQNPKAAAQSNDNLSVTIESDSFITTIQVSNNEHNIRSNSKKSASVQTDISDLILLKNKKLINCSQMYSKTDNISLSLHTKQLSSFEQSKNNICLQNQNMLVKEKSTNNMNECQPDALKQCSQENIHNLKESLIKSKCVVIDESDSDSDMESSGVLVVTADVHKSYDELEYGNTLTTVLNQQEHTSRKRRAARGYTPTSTDSSEKENFNPNRNKKRKNEKKDKK